LLRIVSGVALGFAVAGAAKITKTQQRLANTRCTGKSSMKWCIEDPTAGRRLGGSWSAAKESRFGGFYHVTLT
jgi:hypothetical protein